MIFAQSQIEPSFLLQFFLVVGLLVSIAANVVMIRRSGQTQSRSIGPQPFEVKASVEYATKQELAHLERRFEDNHQEVLNAIDAMDKRREANLTRLHQRMDEMPDRIIALLKNTKSLL